MIFETDSEESDEPYVQAVQAEFDGGSAKRKALAAVILAQSRLHARILDEIGVFLLKEVREKVSTDFEVENGCSLYKCLEEQNADDNWGLSRPSWPENLRMSLASASGDFDEIYFGVKAPDPKSDKVRAVPRAGCSARPKLEGLVKTITGGRKSNWWPWWQYGGIRYWGPEFVARLVIEAPNGEVDQHPHVQELAQQFVQLADAVERALAA